MATNSSINALSSGARAALDEHIELIKIAIIEEAHAASGNGILQPMQVLDAAKLYAPGYRLPTQTYVPFWSRIFESISGITLISALLAIIFGLLGWSQGATAGAGLLDIAKILAGAIVGSTGAAVASSIRSKSSRATANS